MQQAIGLQQQLDFILPKSKMMCLVFTYQMIQWRSQFGHVHHARHVRAAFEGVHGQL